jgi:hypothetical protein
MNIDYVNDKNESLLVRTIQNSSNDNIHRLLLNHNINAETKDNAGFTALDYATKKYYHISTPLIKRYIEKNKKPCEKCGK